MTVKVGEAVKAVRNGGIVVVTDDEERENEGDLIMAAEACTTEAMAFFLRHTSGVLCAAITGDTAVRLDLPPMVPENQESFTTAFTVSVDAADGVSTGISAHDRARTMRLLADRRSHAGSFVRPGHVFPLRAKTGGVLRRNGHTEAAVDLATLAGLSPAGVLCEVTTPDRSAMASRDDLVRLAQEFGLPMISIAELASYRMHREQLVQHLSEAKVPTRHGDFVCHAWSSLVDGTEHVAFVRGDVTTDEPVLVRVHSECLTGDVFGSLRCDCGTQLDDALRHIDEAGRGVVVYLRGHEGRGIGIGHKLRAYELQDQGFDTVDANLELGLPVDSRDYGVGAQILADLGVRRMRLMTNNPAKYDGLSGFGMEIVERVHLAPRPTRQNWDYLATKAARMGHTIDLSAHEHVRARLT
jgi:3,4-dihydroxy 2-butanone 4-phosphate synthase/GTP cyclohydrolase II